MGTTVLELGANASASQGSTRTPSTPAAVSAGHFGAGAIVNAGSEAADFIVSSITSPTLLSVEVDEFFSMQFADRMIVVMALSHGEVDS